MLELLMASRPEKSRITIGPSPIGTFTTQKRTNSAFAVVGTTIYVTGGQAGGPLTSEMYPPNGFKVAVNASGTAGTTSASSGYDGAWAAGEYVGGSFWVAQGHDGKSNNYFKPRAITSTTAGGPLTISGISPGFARCFKKIVAPGFQEHLAYFGLGRNDSGPLSQLYRLDFHPSRSRSKVELASMIDPTIGSCWSQGYACDRFGNLHVMPSDPANPGYRYMRSYNASTNTWSRVDLGYVDEFLAMSSTGIYSGDYAMFFSGMRDTTLSFEAGNCLRCLRYNVVTKEFSLLLFPTIPALYAPNVGIDEVNNRIYVVSGVLPGIDIFAYYDSSPRSTAVYTLSLPALLNA